VSCINRFISVSSPPHPGDATGPLVWA